MKLELPQQGVVGLLSPPSRGAWIEIGVISTVWSSAPLSPPSRGAWIEIPVGHILLVCQVLSPPSRGAWIEMPNCAPVTGLIGVAPLAGGVD